MVTQGGVEPPTVSLGGCLSIQLRYWAICFLAESEGFEPSEISCDSSCLVDSRFRPLSQLSVSINAINMTMIQHISRCREIFSSLFSWFFTSSGKLLFT